MAILTVAADTDFSAQALVNIDIIDFTAAATATFAASQFNNAAILNALTIDGSAGVNRIVINGGAVNVLNWTFANWTDGEDTITFNGTAAADVYLGTGHDDIFNAFGGADFIAAGNGNDIITGGDGGDELHGGGGDDTFIYGALDLDAGEDIFGDAGTGDTIRLNNAASAYLFSTNATTITGIERLEFNTTSAATAEFTGAQMAQFVSVTGGAGADTLRVLGSADLSGVAFTFWSSNDQIQLNGAAAGETITGTGFADRITGGGGNDTLNGGDGDDVFAYASASDLNGAAEIINGGSGAADEIELSGTDSFALNSAAISGVEALDFVSGPLSANLSGTQIGGSLASGRILSVDGSASADALTVAGSSVDLSNVTFTSWTAGIDTISISGNGAAASNLNGTSFGDAITGGALGDLIRGGGGADTLSGGDGSDQFQYLDPSEIASGETVDGGAGNDLLVVGGGLFDFSLVGLTEVNTLLFANAGAPNHASFAAGQLGSGGLIISVLGSVLADTLTVSGASINISGVGFSSWTTGTDSINLTGTAGDDVITGSTQNDTIEGGDGADALNGGGGDDRIVVNFVSHIFGDTYNGGAGLADTLVLNTGIASTFISAASLANVERLEFGANGGSGDFEDASFGLAAGRINTVIGSALTDRLDITGSAVNLTGVAFTGWANGADQIILLGTVGADIIIGSDQNDTFRPNGGADALFGGLGDDTFEFRDVAVALGDSVNGGGGTGDRIAVQAAVDLSSVTIAGIEQLAMRRDVGGSGVNGNVTVLGSQIGAGAISQVTGSDDPDTLNVSGALVDLRNVAFTSWNDNADIINISGTAGADVLRGSLQKDVFAGGAGDDQYLVNNTSDTVTELAGGGNDRLFTFVSFTNVANVERLSLSGTANINGTGVDGQNDIIDGNGANNIINGLTGSDNMNGGAGDDTYHVNTSADVVNEAAGGGFDTIFAQTGYTIAANVERLFLVDGGNFNANGRNGQDDFLAGNSGANIINGFSGNDVIRGGLGNDTLTGGLGLDLFQFLTAPNTALNADVITDFNIADDTIQLDNLVYTLIGANGALAAGLFKNLALGAQDANDVILYDQVSGNLFHDANGLAAGGKTFFADVTNGLALSAADFVVV